MAPNWPQTPIKLDVADGSEGDLTDQKCDFRYAPGSRL